MKYAVYQSNKPATCYHFNLENDKDWENCVFDTLNKAILYAQNWCGSNYPIIPDSATENISYDLPFENSEGMTEFIVIKKYKESVHSEHCCDVHKICKYGDELCPCCLFLMPIPATYGCNCNW